jgi:hypothetical protein
MGCCGSKDDTKPQRAQPQSSGGGARTGSNAAAAGQPTKGGYASVPQTAANSRGGGAFAGGGGRQLGGTAADPELSDREIRARAAEQRKDQAAPGFSRQTTEELRQAGTRERLRAQIHELCHELGEDVPFGLPTLSVAQLQSTKQHLEQKAQLRRRV